MTNAASAERYAPKDNLYYIETAHVHTYMRVSACVHTYRADEINQFAAPPPIAVKKSFALSRYAAQSWH